MLIFTTTMKLKTQALRQTQQIWNSMKYELQFDCLELKLKNCKGQR